MPSLGLGVRDKLGRGSYRKFSFMERRRHWISGRKGFGKKTKTLWTLELKKVTMRIGEDRNEPGKGK